MSKPKHGDIVEVEWVDSEHIALGWDTQTAYIKAADHGSGYRTAGYWVAGSKRDRVVVALSWDAFNRTLTHVMAIPRAAVTGVYVLKRGKR